MDITKDKLKQLEDLVPKLLELFDLPKNDKAFNVGIAVASSEEGRYLISIELPGGDDTRFTIGTSNVSNFLDDPISLYPTFYIRCKDER